VDLRTLLPMDVNAIREIAARTGKVIVLHEATRTGGVGAEIAATIAERAFEYLDAPIVRLAAPDTPVPYAPTLEEAFIPNVDRVGPGNTVPVNSIIGVIVDSAEATPPAPATTAGMTGAPIPPVATPPVAIPQPPPAGAQEAEPARGSMSPRDREAFAVNEERPI